MDCNRVEEKGRLFCSTPRKKMREREREKDWACFCLLRWRKCLNQQLLFLLIPSISIPPSVVGCPPTIFSLFLPPCCLNFCLWALHLVVLTDATQMHHMHGTTHVSLLSLRGFTRFPNDVLVPFCSFPVVVVHPSIHRAVGWLVGSFAR